MSAHNVWVGVRAVIPRVILGDEEAPDGQYPLNPDENHDGYTKQHERGLVLVGPDGNGAVFTGDSDDIQKMLIEALAELTRHRSANPACPFDCDHCRSE